MKDNFVMCRDGKEREVFPALIKHKNKIRHYASEFDANLAIMNMFAIDQDKIDSAEKAKEQVVAEEMFSDKPYDAMMQMLILAFGEKYTQEQIEEFVDVSMIPQILDIFFGVSGYKKKEQMKLMKV